MQRRTRNWTLVMLLGSVSAAQASGNVCLYNGKEWDDRKGKLTHFTGEYSCKDTGTNKVVLREHHADGIKDGRYIKYDFQTGKVEETGTYRRDKLHGVMKRYRNGVLQMEAAYVNGNAIGVQKDYTDGTLSRVYLVVDGGFPDTELYFNKKGQLTQLVCGKRPIGKQDAEWCGVDGKHSTVTLYSADGKVSATEQYLWGKQHGTTKKFNVRTGQMIREEQYENGKRLQGGQRHYDKKGTLLVKTDCDDKRVSCRETIFFEGGKETKTITIWKNGKTTKQTDFYQNGKAKEELVADGAKFRITEYYDTGTVSSKGTYVKATSWYWRSYLPDGLVETFYEDGNISRRENYRAGERQGRAEHFWTLKGHHFRKEAEFDKDNMLKEKLFVDNKLTDEFEYFPDGSLKQHRIVSPSPVIKI